MNRVWIKYIGSTVCIGLASCFVVGGFGKIQGLDFLAEKIYANNFNPYKLSEVYNKDGQEEISFLQLVLSGKIYFDEGWEMESEEAMALALEENRYSEEENVENLSEKDLLNTGSIGDIYGQEEKALNTSAVNNNKGNIIEQLKQTKSFNFLLKNFYIVDSTTSVSKNMFSVEKLLKQDNRIKKNKKVNQILIYHTHGASESFQKGSSKSNATSIVDVGSKLANELREKYGYGVYHDQTKYDLIHGSIDRSVGYNVALRGIQEILEKNKDIQVVIDLHRDGVGKKPSDTVMINGKKTAKVMFFNGLSRSRSGEITYLHNPNLEGNLSFSLQLKLRAMEEFPEFTKPIYLKGYRYNLHLRSRSLLIELGNEHNTIEEANNSITPLAKVIAKVLEG